MPFAYLKDPLFLLCFSAYWAHRWFAAHGMSTEMLRGHLNDVICIPFFVPIILSIHKMFGLRRHDGPPDAVEIVIPLLIWSALFEVVIPAKLEWKIPTIADPYDVLSYCLGAVVAVAFWKWYYSRRRAVMPV